VHVRPRSSNTANVDDRCSADQITPTVASLLAEYSKTAERTVFWSDDLKLNLDPFGGIQGNFFMQDWDFKVRLKYLFGYFCPKTHVLRSAI
jgi:hypothetical protein